MLYYNTEIEVKLGDNVEVGRFFRDAEKGRVYYFPTQSKYHPSFEHVGFSQWAIELDNRILPYIETGKKYTSRRVKFISRNDDYIGLTPNMEQE